MKVLGRHAALTTARKHAPLPKRLNEFMQMLDEFNVPQAMLGQVALDLPHEDKIGLASLEHFK